MAEAQYILTLRMTKNITKVINEKEKMMLETVAYFISICYAPWFLKSYMVNKAPSNDLSAVKSSFHIRDHYPRLRQALLASIQRHCWYLSEHLVLLALANDYIELELKSKIFDKLLLMYGKLILSTKQYSFRVFLNISKLCVFKWKSSFDLLILNITGMF